MAKLGLFNKAKLCHFLLPILSGILLILAYPPYNLEFLAWIALIPLFWFIALKQISPKKALIGGFIAGVLFFGKLFTWFFATAPFEWLGITTKKDIILAFGLVALIWISQTIFLGLFFGVFAWSIKKMAKLSFANKKLSYAIFLTIPSLWVVLEYLRAWGFGIFWLGKETLLGPHWTFGNLAYTLHNNASLIQLADIFGIYGISFLIVLVNVGLFLVLKQCKKPSPAHIAVLLIILGLVGTAWTGYGTYKLESKSYEIKPREVEIALLQTNFVSGSEFNPYQKKEVFEAVLDLFRAPEAIEEKPDIIIAPEGFGITTLTGDKTIARHLLKDFWQPGQIYLENQKIKDENGKTKSRLFYYDLEQEEPLGYHDKMLLVPGGDYLPYSVKLILSIYSFNMKYEQKLYKKGEKIEPTQTPKGKIGGTICSSILSPDLHCQMTKTGAEFLVVVSSDAPFHGSKALLAQNLAMLKLRAVENRRYVAQATNMGYSFLLNPRGEVVIKTSQFGNEILFADIYLLNKKTPYTKLGDWIILLAFLFYIFYFLFSPKNLSTGILDY